jgi:Protein of unknown function (DUF2845)
MHRSPHRHTRPGRPARPARAAAVLASLAASLVLVATPARADGFRCGTKLVVEGATRGEVVARCGEPTEVERRSILRRPVVWLRGRPYHLSDDLVEVPVETWTYNLGPNKLMRRLRLEDGVVVEIDTLGYGYHPGARPATDRPR